MHQVEATRPRSMGISCFHTAVFLRLLPYWLFLASSLPAAESTKNFPVQFQRAYRGTAEPMARRDLVIKAIDNGIIKRGLPLADVKVMFGGDLQIFRRASTNTVLKAVVFFEPAIPPPNPLMSASTQGWYFDLVFSSDDRLERYSLSNIHK